MREIDAMDLGGTETGTGTAFYVDSEVDGTTGVSWATAVGTLQEGIDLCSGNAGDIIYVAQGHAENINAASALNANCAGITIIGLGEGEDQPEISFITDAGAELTISAADTTIYNMRFLSNCAGGLTAGIVITGDGDGARILGCEFRETLNSSEMLIAINAAASADELVIAGNRFIGIAGGSDTVCINLAGASNQSVIADNFFYGDWSDYVIKNGAASISMLIENNVIHNLDADGGGGKIMTFHASSTGSIVGNKCYGNASGYPLVGNGMFVSPDNIVMQTEDVETRTYETMFGPYRGDAAGTAGDSIYADFVLAQTDLDAIIAALTTYGLDELISNDDAAGATAYPDSVVADSVFAFIMSNDTNPVVTSYNNTTDSLEALGEDTDTLLTNVAAIASSIAAMSDTGYVGTCTNNATTTEAIVPLLIGFGDDYFNTGWSMICILDYSAAGSAPEGEIIDIIDYTSATGTFTLNVAFSQALTTGDRIMLKRTEELNLDMPTALGTAGTIWYLDSGASGDATGKTWENASLTLAAVEALMSAGDICYIADGHNENILTGDGVTLNVANTSFIGMGQGDARPLFDMDDDGTMLTIDNAGITLKNLRFRPGVTACNVCLRIEDAAIGCTIEDCAFVNGESSTVDEFTDVITVDTSASYLTIRNCTYFSADATGHTATFLDLGDEATIAGCTIEGCTIFGMFSEAPIYWGAQVPTNLTIRNNTISNTTTGQFCIEGTGNATGVCVGNRLYSDSYLTMLDPGYLKCIDNWGADAIDQQAIRIPISAETSDVTAVADGSELERLEFLQDEAEDILTAMGIDSATANIFYLDSACGTTGAGTEWANAEVTLTTAIGDVTTGTGAVIFVAANHAENIAGSIAINKAGVKIIGLGVGESRPKLTFTAEASALAHTVADVMYKNIIFICSTQDTTSAITLDGSSDGAVFEDCEWRNSTTNEFMDTVTLAAACDNVRFTRCKFLNDTAVGGNISAINSTAGVTNNLIIEDCEFYGTFTTAAIESTQIEVDLTIRNNKIYNYSTSDYAIKLSDAALGVMYGNYCYTPTYGTCIDSGSLQCFDNYISHAIDQSGFLFPAAPVEVPSVHGTGRVIYVDSGVAVAGGGGTWATALQTIDAAMDLTSADRGDTIYVAQGHVEVEDQAAAIFTCDVEGVSIIAISNGSASGVVAAGAVTGTDSQMPLFILDNAAATISITAANVTIDGLWIESDVANAAIGITIANTGDGSVIKNCVFRDGAADEELVIGISVAADADNVQILNNSFSTVPAGGCTNAILLAGGMDDGVIRDNIVYGTYSTGALLASAAASVNLTVMDNIFVTTSANVCVSLNAGTTGIFASNRMGSTDTMANTLQGETAMYCFDNYATGAPAASGVITPAVDAD